MSEPKTATETIYLEEAKQAVERHKRMLEAFDAMKEALNSVPNPGYGQEAQRWMDEEYWPWWHKVRRAALALAEKVRP